MKQNEVNRAVVRATGESVRTIQKMGFSLIEPMAHPVEQRSHNASIWMKQVKERKRS